MSLSIATPDGKLRQSKNSSFRNYIIKESGVLNKIPPENATWFIDGMPLIRFVKAKKNLYRMDFGTDHVYTPR